MAYDIVSELDFILSQIDQLKELIYEHSNLPHPGAEPKERSDFSLTERVILTFLYSNMRTHLVSTICKKRV